MGDGKIQQSVNQQGLYVLVKEAVVPKEFEHPRRAIQDVAVGPQGRCYVRTWQIGVFYPTEVAHRVFPPPTAGFSSCKL